ncbi:MAG TPA: hypothetical protein VF313_00600 [Anaerolineaceae bacterium]
MNNNEVLQNLSSLSFEEIEKRLASGTDNLNLEQLMGAEKVNKIRNVATRRRDELVAPGGDMVVLLPGIMGSLLLSVRGVTDFLWINPLLFLNGHANYLEVGNANIECAPFSLEKMTYLHMALSLRNQFKLFEFPYDWRMPIENNAEILHQCLGRWSADNSGRKFNLVGHSMGGLVMRTYLVRYPKEAVSLIRRAIYLGSPLLGATTTIQNLGVGNSIVSTVDGFNPANHMREAVLSMPSVYQLMPAPPDLFPVNRAFPADWNLFDASAWHVDGLRQDLLDAAQAFHRSLAGQDIQVEQIMVAGCNIPSITVVKRTLGPDGKPQWEFPTAASGKDSGDGTVPLWSSTTDPSLKVYYVQCVHRDLPNHDDVIAGVQRLVLTGQCDLPAALPQADPSSIFEEAAQELEELKNRLIGGTASQSDFSKLSVL